MRRNSSCHPFHHASPGCGPAIRNVLYTWTGGYAHIDCVAARRGIGTSKQFFVMELTHRNLFGSCRQPSIYHTNHENQRVQSMLRRVGLPCQRRPLCQGKFLMGPAAVLHTFAWWNLTADFFFVWELDGCFSTAWLGMDPRPHA